MKGNRVWGHDRESTREGKKIIEGILMKRPSSLTPQAFLNEKSVEWNNERIFIFTG